MFCIMYMYIEESTCSLSYRVSHKLSMYKQCLVHVLTVAHVLILVNVHHRRYDAHPMATLVPSGLNVSM